MILTPFNLLTDNKKNWMKNVQIFFKKFQIFSLFWQNIFDAALHVTLQVLIQFLSLPGDVYTPFWWISDPTRCRKRFYKFFFKIFFSKKMTRMVLFDPLDKKLMSKGLWSSLFCKYSLRQTFWAIRDLCIFFTARVMNFLTRSRRAKSGNRGNECKSTFFSTFFEKNFFRCLLRPIPIH